MSDPAGYGNLIVYSNGGYRRYDEARVGLLTHGLQYGTGCFEGIRGYWNEDEQDVLLFQLHAHYERLTNSSRMLLMDIGHSVDELVEISAELCARNEFRGHTYLRAIVFKNMETIGVKLRGIPETTAIIAVPHKSYYDAANGLRVGVSSWRRADDTMAPVRAKVTGLYINAALAKSEAEMNGFDEAIMLSQDGHISECSAENLFLVRDNVLYTPDPSQNILEGITRKAIMTLAREELGLTVVERALDRSEAYTADELFFTGTAVGVDFANSVDHRPIGDGSMGPITRKLAALYNEAVLGRLPKYRSWVTPTYARPSRLAAAAR
jgi:branched-chain amino acid aminotransferase